MNIPSINVSLQANGLMANTAGAHNPPSERLVAGNSAPSGASSTSAPVEPGLKPASSKAIEESGAASKPASLEQVQQAMEEVRNAITPMAQDLLFSIDQDTGKTIVKVVDASTDKVIRQIPSEEIITIAKALDKLQGLLIEQKA